jgi:hypothetical protein
VGRPLFQHFGGFVERAGFAHGHAARPRIGVLLAAARQG